MTEAFVEMLNEPKNSLGRTEEVVAIVLNDPSRLDELYQCFFQPDEWVRLRASSSFKRIWRADAELFGPYLQGWIDDVSAIDQPSVNWTFSQLCTDLGDSFSGTQRSTATKRMKGYLATSDDWIVQNTTMEALGLWAANDTRLKRWLLPHLERLAALDKKSVAKRAAKLLASLSEQSKARP